MIRRAAAALSLLAALALPPAARAEVPVGIRVVRASKQGPAQIDPRLADLKRQISPLAYVRWEQVSEKKADLKLGKTEFVELPGGDSVGVTLQEHRGNTLTLEVAITQRNTQSRVTVEKGQRIVHGVSPEKGGEAVFIVLTGWP
ncbi:MAG: hypothetical protein U0229_22180 [Anaeromyxobacter sp.]